MTVVYVFVMSGLLNALPRRHLLPRPIRGGYTDVCYEWDTVREVLFTFDSVSLLLD